MTDQSNAAAERSAHVERGPKRSIPGESFLVEVKPGVFQIKALAEARAEIERLREQIYESIPKWQANELQREIERLRAALQDMLHAVCGETGFAAAVRAHSGIAYPWEPLDIAEEKARAALGENGHE